MVLMNILLGCYTVSTAKKLPTTYLECNMTWYPSRLESSHCSVYRLVQHYAHTYNGKLYSDMFWWQPPERVGLCLDCISTCIVLDQLVDSNLIDMHSTNNIVKLHTITYIQSIVALII